MDALMVCFGWEHARKIVGRAKCGERGRLWKVTEGSLEEIQGQAQSVKDGHDVRTSVARRAFSSK